MPEAFDAFAVAMGKAVIRSATRGATFGNGEIRAGRALDDLLIFATTVRAKVGWATMHHIPNHT